MKRYILPIAALLIPLAPRAGGIECLTNDVPSADEVTIPPVRGARGVIGEEIDESYLTLATPPADLTTTTYRMEAFECSIGKNLDYQVQLGFAGDEVWIQGISEAFPESWVKGDMQGDRLIIDKDQYLGIYTLSGTDYNIWLTGINHDMARFEEPQFTYNPRTGIFTQIDGNWLVVNGSLTEWKWLNNMSDIMLSPVTDEEELADHYTLVAPPSSDAAFTTSTFTASGFDYSFGAPAPLAEYSVELGLANAATAAGSAQQQGGPVVYVRGLFSDMPEAWIKGSVTLAADGTPATLTFDSLQYMGRWFDSIDCWFMGVDSADMPTSVTFDYDAMQQAFVQRDDVRIFFNDSYIEPSPMALQMIGGLKLASDCSHLLDALSPVTIAPLSPDQHYNLAGQTVNVCSPGIYVSSGRKHIVK